MSDSRCFSAGMVGRSQMATGWLRHLPVTRSGSARPALSPSTRSTRLPSKPCAKSASTSPTRPRTAWSTRPRRTSTSSSRWAAATPARSFPETLRGRVARRPGRQGRRGRPPDPGWFPRPHRDLARKPGPGYPSVLRTSESTGEGASFLPARLERPREIRTASASGDAPRRRIPVRLADQYRDSRRPAKRPPGHVVKLWWYRRPTAARRRWLGSTTCGRFAAATANEG
jgi:hypothetical protein